MMIVVVQGTKLELLQSKTPELHIMWMYRPQYWFLH